MFAKPPKRIRFARTERKVINESDGTLEPEVIPHMAYDVAEIDQLRKQGRTISTHNVENMYYDGEFIHGNITIPLDQVRGIDRNDIWSQSVAASERVTKAGVKHVLFGNQN